MAYPLLVLPKLQKTKCSNKSLRRKPINSSNYEMPFHQQDPSSLPPYQRIHHEAGNGAHKKAAPKTRTRKEKKHHEMEMGLLKRDEKREISRFLGFWYLGCSIRYILRKANALFYNELCCDAYDEGKAGKLQAITTVVDPYFSIPVAFP